MFNVIVQVLRFRPPRWVRYLWLTAAVLGWTSVALEHRAFDVIQAIVWTLGATLWWLAVDTIVDAQGVRTAGAWFRERIEWRQVQRFAVDRATGKPVLVLVGGRRKSLAYVPDSAWENILARWQQATGHEV